MVLLLLDELSGHSVCSVPPWDGNGLDWDYLGYKFGEVGDGFWYLVCSQKGVDFTRISI